MNHLFMLQVITFHIKLNILYIYIKYIKYRMSQKYQNKNIRNIYKLEIYEIISSNIFLYKNFHYDYYDYYDFEIIRKYLLRDNIILIYKEIIQRNSSYRNLFLLLQQRFPYPNYNKKIKIARQWNFWIIEQLFSFALNFIYSNKNE